MSKRCTKFFYGRSEAQAFIDGLDHANKGDVHAIELIGHKDYDGPYYTVSWTDESPDLTEPQNASAN